MSQLENVQKTEAVDGCVISKPKEVSDTNGVVIKAESNGNKNGDDAPVDYNHNNSLPQKAVDGQSEQQQSNGKEEPKQTKNDDGDEEESSENSEGPTFEPRISLPLVEIQSMEDNEDVLVELRARIYRYDTTGEEEPEFKERGTGTIKILKHNETKRYRVLMRRDKTLKICANHYITAGMKLNPHNNSEKVFIYSTLADLYEDQINPETFAIRFGNLENATKFKECFDDAVKYSATNVEEEHKDDEKQTKEDSSEVAQLTSKVENIQINKKEEDKEKEDSK